MDPMGKPQGVLKTLGFRMAHYGLGCESKDFADRSCFECVIPCTKTVDFHITTDPALPYWKGTARFYGWGSV